MKLRRSLPEKPGAKRSVPVRRGVTLLEVLVVTGIIALLISLLLPAMVQSRGAARRVTCMSHLRQLSLAMNMHVDQTGRYPASGLFEATGPRQYHNWVVSLLPQLDQASLFREYDLSKSSTDESNRKVTNTPIAILVCPDDVSVEEGQGNMSYVVNGGLSWTIPIDCPAALHADKAGVAIVPVDFNGDGILCPLEEEREQGTRDVDLLKRTSLFFVENWPSETGTQRFHRPRDVTDGMTQTLLLSENLRAGYDPRSGTDWGSPEPPRNSFFVSSYVCESGNCGKDKVRLSRANERSLEPFRQESLNSSRHQAEGIAPWPSSEHHARIHFAWCDGRVSGLSENIDGETYFALTTPQGLQGDNEPLREPAISGDQF